MTGTYGDAGRGIIRGPGSFNIDASLIKNTKIGRVDTEFRRRGVQRAQPPAVRATRTRRSATPPFGTISAMLSSPSCSLCGTTERQVQLAMKVRF